jgi:hypothetical protein
LEQTGKKCLNYPKNRKKPEPINSEEERKERHRYYARKYNENNKEALREKRTRHILKNYEKYMWSVAKQSAKARGIEFNIEPTDITLVDTCPYLGLKLEKNIGTYRGTQPNSISLDRIDSSKGYVKGNIQVVSLLANKCKSNLDLATLVTFAEGVLKMHKTV